MGSEAHIRDLLSYADIEVDGSKPWDVKVHNARLYDRVLAGGSLGAGEAYMDRWWDCEKLDVFFDRLIRANLESKIKGNYKLILQALLQKIFNYQSRNKAVKENQQHYNLGNDLFRKMLDQRMIYSCGYWKSTVNLDEAQENKLDLICRKLNFEEGMEVLDIGCGWGGFARFAAEKYKVKVTGISVSPEQVKLAKAECAGLPVEIREMDYRELNGRYDRIVSIGMVEHVGYKNYRTFMKVAHRCLKDDGLFLLHTIGSNYSRVSTDPWLNKYIFPNSVLPSIPQLGKAMEHLFVMEDWHNFGVDYDKTLMAWYQNFEQGWPQLKERYGDRFFRMWRFYLLSAAASFRSRKNQLWQIVLSKKGVPEGYESIR